MYDARLTLKYSMEAATVSNISLVMVQLFLVRGLNSQGSRSLFEVRPEGYAAFPSDVGIGYQNVSAVFRFLLLVPTS